jgi:hypothetical protein
MPTNSRNPLSLLLELVLEKHGHLLNHSKDCDHLALVLTRTTGEVISGSTIKRLLGFIQYTSKPNKYTLNLLAKFIGFRDYATFLEVQYGHGTTEDSANFTNRTLSFLKSKFLHTNSYLFPVDGIKLLNDFILTDKKALGLIAEGGNGKTQLLATFVETSAAQNKTLFLEASELKKHIINTSLSNWISSFTNEIDLLIVDGLDETAYKFEEIQVLFNEILRFISTDESNLKLILSMRPFTWLKVSGLIKSEEQKLKWSNPINPLLDILEACNLPLLDRKTIQTKFPNAPNTIIELIRRPFFYSIYSHVPNHQIANDWDLLVSFFNLTLWNTAHVFEKNQFIEKFLQVTKNGELGNTVSRADLEELLIRYKKAFLNLNTFNILSEIKEVNKFGRYQSHFRFGHAYYFDFFILSTILENTDGNILLAGQHIINHYQNEQRISLLKLLMSYGCSNCDSALGSFFDLPLDELERRPILIHLSEMVYKNEHYQREIAPKFVQTESGRKHYIERFIDIDKLNGYYGDLIKQYLELVSHPQDLLFGNCLIYFQAFLDNDRTQCDFYYQKMKAIDISKVHIHPFVIGRRFMTFMLQDFLQTGDYSSVLISDIEHALAEKRRENDSDLPVHFAGIEYNILHAEYLTKKYVFTEKIIESWISEYPDRYKDGSKKMYLGQLFISAFRYRSNHIKLNEAEFESLDTIYPEQELYQKYRSMLKLE